MTEAQAADVRAIVVETLAEQQRLRQDDIDAVVLKAVATTLTSFGIEKDDRWELRADFQHLRRWRRCVEQAQSYTFKAVITGSSQGLSEQCGSASRRRWANDRCRTGAQHHSPVANIQSSGVVDVPNSCG